jgi:hypothetical protein
MNLGKGFETSIKMNYVVDNMEYNSEKSHHMNLKPCSSSKLTSTDI